MRISLASDHAGFPLKSHFVEWLHEAGQDVVDFGTASDEPVDYPVFVVAAARAVADHEVDVGIVFGGSGQGEQIAANKVHGIRAALCHDVYSARMSRRHNDANVLAMGARIVAPTLAEEIVREWLDSPFDGGRHARRIDQISSIEAQECHLEF